MKIPPPRYPSPLGRAMPVTMDIDATKRDGWRDLKILVVAENDARLDWTERELIRRIGERLYGPNARRAAP